MTDPKQEDLQQREAALRQRELELRMRELEVEVNQMPVSPTVKHQVQATAKPGKLRQITIAAKFFGIVVAMIAAVKIATWMAGFLLFGTVVWVVYQIFLAGKRSK
jgi:hypothetical protein